MIRIRRDLVDAMVAHARRDHPDEACGILAGPEGSDQPERIVEMLNSERSPTGYRFDDNEWGKVGRRMAVDDEEPVVVYHSHTMTEAYPSRTDVRMAGEYAKLMLPPHYVLISTRDPEEHELRSFRIVDGEITEEPVEVVESNLPDTD